MMQAGKLSLPHISRPPTASVASLLFEHSSNTLALMHSDSSILLFPSLSPFNTTTSLSSSSPQTQTLIPPFSTSSTFLKLQSNQSPPRVLFVVTGPRHGDSRVLLRFWILNRNSNSFVKARIVSSSNQRGFVCDEKLGVFVGLSHGVSVRLVGGVNVLVMHSVSEKKIWVFSAKMVGEGEDRDCVKFMKCSVIDCSIPICSITVSLGFLVLGESNGVRVFPLRVIVKGRVKKQRDSARRKEKKNCGGCSGNGASKCVDNGRTGKSASLKEPVEISSNDCSGKAEMKDASSKLRTVKLKQDSSVGGTFFVPFNCSEGPCQKLSTKPLLLLRAVSVHSLSQKKFLIVDSDGDLHVLVLYSTKPGSEITGHMRRLSHTMKVRMLAVLPDISTRTQTFWISDGINSVHVMLVSDMEVSSNENDKSESEEKQMQISATQAIFASEKIQDLIPLSANAILVLGQGNIFTYAIS